MAGGVDRFLQRECLERDIDNKLNNNVRRKGSTLRFLQLKIREYF
jgi:hypothetical protein